MILFFLLLCRLVLKVLLSKLFIMVVNLVLFSFGGSCESWLLGIMIIFSFSFWVCCILLKSSFVIW